MHCRSFLTKKLEIVPGTSFIWRISLNYWTQSIHRSWFPISKTLTFNFLQWIILTHFERSRKTYLSSHLAWATCEYWYNLSFMHLQMTLQLLLIPHYSISFLKLLTIINHHLFGAKLMMPLIFLQRISNVPISVLIDFPFYVWYNCRYIGLLNYADVLGYMILFNHLNDHCQNYHSYSAYATWSPFLGLLFVHLFFLPYHVLLFYPHRSFDSYFWPRTSLWSCIKIIKCTTSYRPHNWHFDTPYFCFQDWKRPRRNYQSFGSSHETSRLGSTFLSHPPHLGTLSFIYLYLYFTFYLACT